MEQVRIEENHAGEEIRKIKILVSGLTNCLGDINNHSESHLVNVGPVFNDSNDSGIFPRLTELGAITETFSHSLLKWSHTLEGIGSKLIQVSY